MYRRCRCRWIIINSSKKDERGTRGAASRPGNQPPRREKSVPLHYWGWSTLGPAYNEYKNAKEIAGCKCARCNQTFNIVVNDVDAKKSVRYSRVLIVTELVVSEIQCGSFVLNLYVALDMSLALHRWFDGTTNFQNFSDIPAVA